MQRSAKFVEEPCSSRWLPVTSGQDQISIENAIRDALRAVPGARFTVGGGDLGEKLALILSSDDATALDASARALERELRGVPGLSNITSTASLERPEIVVHPHLTLATEQGISTAAIAETVRFATSGDLDTRASATRSRQAPDLYPCAASRRRETGSGRARQSQNPRQSGSGSPRARGGPGAAGAARRRSRATIASRQVTVEAELGGMALGDALNAALALPSIMNLPSSVQIIESFDAELMAELGAGFGMALAGGRCSASMACWCCCFGTSCNRSRFCRRFRCRWVAHSSGFSSGGSELGSLR